MELADAKDGRAAFYQIRSDSLPLYLDAGLRIVKVGEEACIYLKQFNLEARSAMVLRQALKRGEFANPIFEPLSAREAAQLRGE